jgi:hypothetical protein
MWSFHRNFDMFYNQKISHPQESSTAQWGAVDPTLENRSSEVSTPASYTRGPGFDNRRKGYTARDPPWFPQSFKTNAGID